MSDLLFYNGYHGTVHYNAEDNLLVGEVVGVQDSLNYHGNTIDEITESFQNCVDEYLEVCRLLGRDPDREYKGSFNVRLTPELHRQADLAAKKEGISLNQYVQDAIREKLGNAQQQNPPFYIISTERLRVEVPALVDSSGYAGA